MSGATGASGGPMRVVLVDAFDSFVHVIEQYLGAMGLAPTVVRTADDNLDTIARIDPAFVVLGPGPGHPTESTHVDVARALAGTTPLLGVCLGHQAVAAAFGGHVVRAGHLMHGKCSTITHDGRGMFADAPQPLTVTRYHSLVVDPDTLPAAFEVTARSDDDGYVMAMRHRELPIESVQFHPESILTQVGMDLLANFVRAHVDAGFVPAAR